MDNETSPSYTSLTLRCRDRKGLLYDLFRALKDISLRWVGVGGGWVGVGGWVGGGGAGGGGSEQEIPTSGEEHCLVACQRIANHTSQNDAEYIFADMHFHCI